MATSALETESVAEIDLIQQEYAAIIARVCQDRGYANPHQWEEYFKKAFAEAAESKKVSAQLFDKELAMLALTLVRIRRERRVRTHLKTKDRNQLPEPLFREMAEELYKELAVSPSAEKGIKAVVVLLHPASKIMTEAFSQEPFPPQVEKYFIERCGSLPPILSPKRQKVS